MDEALRGDGETCVEDRDIAAAKRDINEGLAEIEQGEERVRAGEDKLKKAEEAARLDVNVTVDREVKRVRAGSYLISAFKAAVGVPAIASWIF